MWPGTNLEDDMVIFPPYYPQREVLEVEASQIVGILF